MKIKNLLLLFLMFFSLLIFTSCETRINTHTVTFDYGTKDLENYSDEIEKGQKITEPDEIVWPGYKFIGWYSNINLTEDFRWVFTIDVVNEDLTLYAKWEPTQKEFEVIKTQKTYLEGTEYKFDVYKYETNIAGPTIFILGGIHGDERAGWQAALRMIDYDFKRGTVYVLPIANGKAASMSPPSRHFGQDLNRSFPGNINGTPTDKLAYYIYGAIRNAQPDLVLDLHESRRSYENGGLGNQIILHDGLYSLYLDGVIRKVNNLELMADKLKYRMDSYPPDGSINKTFTENENIPVLTIETNREYINRVDTVFLEDRIAEQLAIIEIILDDFEVIK